VSRNGHGARHASRHVHRYRIGEVGPEAETVPGVCACGVVGQFNPHPAAGRVYQGIGFNACTTCGERSHKARDCYRVVR
jgi:hypothetical protein